MVAEKFFKAEQQGVNIKDNILIGNSRPAVTTGLGKLILDALSESPDFVGQINLQTGENITFADLKDRSIRCALWLKKQGIGKGDVIGIATPNQTNDCIPCLATYYLGATFNPWYHELTSAIACHFFKQHQPKVMFACEQSIDLLVDAANEANSDCQFVVYGHHSKYPSLTDLLAQQSQLEIDNFQPNEVIDPKRQPGAIFFSSGTTGIQKGTMLSYATLQNGRFDMMGIKEDVKALWYSSMSWITGTSFLVQCIRTKSTRIMHAEFDPRETSRIIEKYKVSWAFLTPSMLTQLCKTNIYNQFDFSSLKTLYTGGCKPSQDILKETRKALPHTLVSNTYGMTEAGGLISLQMKNFKRIDSIGHIVDGGIKLKIFDESTGDALGPNQQGEICIKLDYLMLGYHNKPEETKKMIDEEGWLHTGDLGYYDEDGEISITDRIKDVIITQNHHISPSQIENILIQHPEVIDVAVVPVPHEIDSERPLAFVKRVSGAKVTAETLRELPTSYNEYFRLTGGVVFVDDFSITPSGKKRTKLLKDMAKTYAQ